MENKKLELMTQDLSAGYDGKTIVSDVSIASVYKGILHKTTKYGLPTY